MSKSTDRRGLRPMRDLPVFVWLAAAVVVPLEPGLVPMPEWLTIHLLLLGAVSHALMVWSRLVADAQLGLRTTPRGQRAQAVRLVVLNVAVAAVLVGVSAGVWPATVAGSVAIAGAVAWHGVALAVQMHRARPGRFGSTLRYYVVAACLLPVGAGLGVMMARGLAMGWHARVMVAHVAVNVLGWMALVAIGTLVTLWPTLRRTRINGGAELAARRALPVFVLSVLTAATGALLGVLPLVAVGLVGYLVGACLVAGALLVSAPGRPPATYPAWSVLAGLGWLIAVVAYLAVVASNASSFLEVHQHLEASAPLLTVGFGVQVLLGALSSWLPAGGSPRQVRAARAVLDRGGPLRIVLVNGGLAVRLIPRSGAVGELGTALLLVGLASFFVLLALAIRISRKADTAVAAVTEQPARQGAGQAALGLAALALAIALGMALNPALALSGSTAYGADVQPTGQTTHVTVTAANMRYTPATIRVPAGNRLVIDFRNTDTAVVHDLVLASGARTGRLAPGRSAQLDAGVIKGNLDGWCSVPGHRQMGMVLHIVATGVGHASASGLDQMLGMSMPASAASSTGSRNAAKDLDFLADPGPHFKAYNAELPPLDNHTVHRATWKISEIEQEVAPGVRQRRWTFGGSAPGPVLHGRVGDRFVVKVVNDGTVAHGIDFHAGSLAPDTVMKPIPPGHSIVYKFTAERAGIWMYHCSSMPMSVHIANGMFGAVVIEPANLPQVDRSYVLVQSELYLGRQGGAADVAKVKEEKPDAEVFNGYANQYDHDPLTAKVGDRVRVWVLDAGPSRWTAFHVVGTQFDTTYSEGAYLLHCGDGGAQVLPLAPAQGGFVEMTFPEPGHYPFVSHSMVDAERGAHGLFDVTQ
ncbi:MAG: multicopper oxidase domain-containing protein [Nocardioidaceae bacterium]